MLAAQSFMRFHWNKSRRHYHRLAEHIAFCRSAEMRGAVINVKWAIRSGLSDSPVAARQLFHRLVMRGILEPVKGWHFTWYELTEKYSIRKNVTLASSNEKTKSKPSPDLADTAAYNPISSTNNLEICQSLQNSRTLVCNTDSLQKNASDDSLQKKISSVLRRVRCFRKKRTPKPYTPRLACALMGGRFGFSYYGELGSRAAVRGINDRRFYDAIDSVADSVGYGSALEGHNFAFMTRTLEPPDASLFADIHSRNRCLADSVIVGGRKVNFKLYPTGSLEIQPCISESPLPLWAGSLAAFMRDIQARLPFATPPVQEWRIACVDFNFPDVDITDQKNERWVQQLRAFPIQFKFRGSTVHSYVKDYDGRTWVRVELTKEHPPCCNINDFPALVQAAQDKLKGCCGRAASSSLPDELNETRQQGKTYIGGEHEQLDYLRMLKRYDPDAARQYRFRRHLAKVRAAKEQEGQSDGTSAHV
jgi:hypothetical protein